MSVTKTITGEFISQLGLVRVEIYYCVCPDINDCNCTDITFDIATIGSINYDFDQTPDSVSVDRVQALYSSVDISAPNFSRTGVNIWERLIDATQDASVRVLLTVGVGTANEYEFPFRLRSSDISFDERSRMIKMRFIPFINENAIVKQVFDNIEADGDVTIPSATGQPSVATDFDIFSVKKFIKEGLKVLFGNNYDDTFLSAKINIQGLADEIYDLSKRQPNFLPTPQAPDVSFCLLDPYDNTNNRDKFSALREGATEFEGTGLISSPQLPQQIGNDSLELTPSLIQVTGTGTSFLTEIQGGDVIFVNGYEIGVVSQVDSNTVMSVNIGTDAIAGGFTNSAFSVLRPIVPSKIPVINMIKDLAGIEGAFFGTGFSRNFYVNRIRKEDITPITLDWNKVVNFSPSMYSLSLGRSLVAQRASKDREGAQQYGRWPIFQEVQGAQLPQSVDYDIPNLKEFESITTGNPNGTKGLEIGLAPAYPLLNKVNFNYPLVNGVRQLGRSLQFFFESGGNTNPESALTSIGLQSYFQALNNSSNGLMVEFTILDAFSIKPWDIFQFDSRAPEKYRNRQWRVTKIAYNIIDNTVTVKAYQIDDVQTPVFSRNPLNFGINASFGQGLLPSGLFSSVQAQIGDAVGDTQDVLFTTAEQVSGETSQFLLQGTGQLDPSAFPNGIVALAGYSVKIVIPTTLESFNAVLTKDLLVSEQEMSIESINIGNRVIPTGSYVFVSQKQVSAGIITGDLSARLFAEADTIGVLTENVVGSVTAIPVLLNTRVRKGQDLDILGTVSIGGSEQPRVYHFTVADDYEAGFHNAMAIESGAGDAVFINARAGDSIRGNPVATQAEIVVSPGEISLSVQNERNEQSIAIIKDDVSQGTITQLPVENIEDVELLDGQKLAIISLGTQEPIEVTVNGKQTQSDISNISNINVVSIALPRPIAKGETIVEPAYAQSSRISINSDQIVLKVDSNGNVASVELIGDANTGSAININADQVRINGIDFVAGDASNIADLGYIESNFDEGVTGWRIDGNGNAEFNNVVVRGTLETSNITGDIAVVSNGKIEWDGGRIDNDGLFFKTEPTIGSPRIYWDNNQYMQMFQVGVLRFFSTFMQGAGYQLSADAVSLTATAEPISLSQTKVDDTTNSTNSTTGSLIVDGGLGVAKNIWAGEQINAGQTLHLRGVQTFTDTGGTISNTVSVVRINDSAAQAFTYTLPSATGSGKILTIKDVSGTAGVSPHTINRAGSDTIDGSTSISLNTTYGNITLLDGASGRWDVISQI